MYVGAKNNQTLKETHTINTSHFKLHVPSSSQPFLIQCVQVQEYGDHKEVEFKAIDNDP